MIYLRWFFYSIGFYILIVHNGFLGIFVFFISHEILGNNEKVDKGALLIYSNKFLQVYAVLHLFAILIYIMNNEDYLVNSSVISTVLIVFIVFIPFLPDIIKREIDDFINYKGN